MCALNIDGHVACAAQRLGEVVCLSPAGPIMRMSTLLAGLALQLLVSLTVSYACSCEYIFDPTIPPPRIECPAGSLVVYGTVVSEFETPCEEQPEGAPSEPSFSPGALAVVVAQLRVDCVLSEPGGPIAVGDIVRVATNPDQGLCGNPVPVGTTLTLDGGSVADIPECELAKPDAPVALFGTYACDASRTGSTAAARAAIAERCGGSCAVGDPGPRHPVPTPNAAPPPTPPSPPPAVEAPAPPAKKPAHPERTSGARTWRAAVP